MPERNGVTEVKMLTQEQTARLQEKMQPLVSQWKAAQAYISGFLDCAGITATQFNLDLNTGVVTLVVPMLAPVGEKDAALVERTRPTVPGVRS